MLDFWLQCGTLYIKINKDDKNIDLDELNKFILRNESKINLIDISYPPRIDYSIVKTINDNVSIMVYGQK